MNIDLIPEEIKTNLKNVTDHFCEEDRAVRERQIRLWRKLKLYWNGFTRIWYSENAHDWRVWSEDANTENSSDSAYYDKPVNVFKAYLEAIIAALSITVPAINCHPDDADNPLDVSTAKAGNKIAELISKHNNASLLWLHALYLYCTEGMIACYSYPRDDKKYGTVEKQEFKEDEIDAYICPNCNARMSDELFAEREADEFQPGEEDVELHDQLLNDNIIFCPECSAEIDPELQQSKMIVTRLVGITHEPKTRQCMEVYGGLYVKVPHYIKKQEDTPYLIFSYETHYANALEFYPSLRDKILKGGASFTSGAGGNDVYEKWGRLNTQYYGEYPTNNVTVRNCWFRPSAYNVLGSKDKVDALKEKYPDGVKVVFVDECLAEVCAESLDDYWTLTHNPMSDFIHHDPLGVLLVSVQDIVNDLISLIVQTIEQGIPSTVADPAVLDFTKYKSMESTPGAVYPAKPQGSNKNISEGFFTLKAAALGEEVMPFMQSIQQLGQLSSGSLPSLFGGMAEAGSKTASEYSMSRAQALQRLQTPWKMLSSWWKEIFGKVIPQYIKDMTEDERLVEKDKQGNFVNVFIRKAEVQGKIGNIELESSENIPVSWQQVKDVIMRIMELNNPQLLEALFAPENIHYVTEALGLPQFKLPAEDDRQKQNEEIQQLLASEPIMQPPDPMMMEEAEAQGMPLQDQQMPSVEVDPDLDNHEIEAQICRQFLISEAGRLAKIQNPAGYTNVLLHMKQHMMIVQQMMMQQQQQAAIAEAEMGGSSPPKKPAEKGSENGVRTPIQ